VARAALERTESRGGHTREDHPKTEAEWGKVNLVLRQREDGIIVERVPLEPPPAELKVLLEGEVSH
jgi:succinate dehydrogenase / fumarate reductase, flavoprotein subunit